MASDRMAMVQERLGNAARRSVGERIGAAKLRIWRANVEGLEVTQTIQHYRSDRHLTDPNDRGDDNSVRLIASKPAWVRVYVGSAVFSDITGITGTLTVERRHHGFLFDPVTTLAPQPPGTVTAVRDSVYSIVRSTLADTLNFVIPAADFWGNLRLTVRLVGSSGVEHDVATQHIDATLRQTLRLRGIMVSYNGPATATMPPPGAPPVPTVTLAAPRLADLQSTASLAMRAMPVQSQGWFTSAGTLAWTQPLDDPRSCPGCCSANWDALLVALTNQRTNDGNRTDVVYYGLLPVGIPIGVPGCGQGGLGSAVVGDGMTLLHEIGHGYGFDHTPCGNAGATDPDYPTYEPWLSASIGEFGLDIATGDIYSPAATSDYMSYCGPRWMSLYQHDRLLQHPRLGQEWLRDDLPWKRYQEWREYHVVRDLPDPPPDPYRWDEMRLAPVIAISGLVHGPDEIEVRSVARVAAAGQPPGTPTSYTAQLVGDDGAVLARASLRRLTTFAGGCECGGGHDTGDDDHTRGRFSFEAYVPDVAPGSALVIANTERPVWERKAPAAPPAVGDIAASVTDDGRLTLRWDASTGSTRGRKRTRADDAVGDVWAQWSVDDGASWHGLATGLRGDGATVDLTGVEPGPVLVRVLVHDGFSTAISDAVRIEVPDRGADAVILHPEDGALVAAGSSLRLWATVIDAAGSPVLDAWCRWVLDGREVAQGTDAWVVAPGGGEHRLTLLARAAGSELERTVTLRCDPGREARPNVC